MVRLCCALAAGEHDQPGAELKREIVLGQTQEGAAGPILFIVTWNSRRRIMVKAAPRMRIDDNGEVEGVWALMRSTGISNLVSNQSRRIPLKVLPE